MTTAPAFKIYVLTRSFGRDYTFVGPSPANAWWREFRDFMMEERPGVVLQSSAEGVKAAFFGIPSTRRDRVGTQIRWTVFVECADRGMGDILAKLARESLLSTHGEGALKVDGVRALLEEHLGAQIETASDDDWIPDALTRLKDGLARSPLAASADPNSDWDWYGGVAERDVADRFAENVRQFPGSKKAFAAFFNLLDADEAQGVREGLLRNYDSVILLHRGDGSAQPFKEVPPMRIPKNIPQPAPTRESWVSRLLDWILRLLRRILR